MIVDRISVGELDVNCYVVACESTGQALVIDPGAEGERIAQFIRTHDYTLRLIVNTHGHFDHIGGNAYLKKEFSPALAIHASDEGMLSDPATNLSAMIPGGTVVCSPPPDQILDEGDRLTVGTVSLDVIHTPGHTPGSICLLCPDLLFSGDTLFRDGIGRTDLPLGDSSLLRDSLAGKVFVLPDTVHVCSGHGPETSVGRERQAW